MLFNVKILSRCTALLCLMLGLTFQSYSVNAEEKSFSQISALLCDFNQTILKIAETEDGFLTLKGLRTVTMMHIAMHDALNSIERQFAGYAYHQSTQPADPIAALAFAGYNIGINQYPDQQKMLATLRDKWTPLGQNDKAIQASLNLGELTASAILQQRQNDGWNNEAEYRWHPMAPGVYAEFNQHSGTPEGFIFGAGWAKAKGFALDKPDQFRSPPPPKINSDTYTEAFNEVKSLGRFQSVNRTPDQTHLALWWKDFAENSHNRLARDLVQREQLNPHQTARLFALVNMSIYDAYISSFDNKFHYNHWRPFTAIRWADNDENPSTEVETTWTNTHRHTYAFPSYPSAHGTACAASFNAFAAIFGNDYQFTMRTPLVDIAGPYSGKIEMHPPYREFSSFSKAAMECAESRVYLGIHFRYDSIAGVELGDKVGKNITSRYLLPMP